MTRVQSHRSAAIDILRFSAAIAVLFFHWVGQTESVFFVFGGSPVDIFGRKSVPASYGFLGVDLFFIISGIVISQTAINKTQGEFFRSRFSRLAPAFLLLAVVATFISVFYSRSVTKVQIYDLLANLTMLPEVMGSSWSDGIYWTLQAEWKFYILIGILYFVGRISLGVLRKFAYVWLGITIGLLASGGIPFLNYFFIPEVSPLFIAGILVGTATNKIEKLMAIIPILICFGLSAKWRFTFSLSTMDVISGHTNPSIIVLLLFVIFSILIFVTWNQKIYGLQSKSASTLGLISYPVYLLNGTIGLALLAFWADLNVSPTVSVVISLAIVFVVSYLVARFWEPFGRKILNKYTRIN